jgi:hypothetical protein
MRTTEGSEGWRLPVWVSDVGLAMSAQSQVLPRKPPSTASGGTSEMGQEPPPPLRDPSSRDTGNRCRFLWLAARGTCRNLRGQGQPRCYRRANNPKKSI